MNKPTKIIRNPIYNYSEIIDYIEEKYHIETRDYAGRHRYFRKWLELMNETPPNYPNKLHSTCKVKKNNQMVEITQEEYNVRYKEIHEQYARFTEWCKNNSEPPYLDFWHWLINNDFLDVENGSYATLNVKYWLDNLDESDWQREIIQLIYNEFRENEMEFLIEW